MFSDYKNTITGKVLIGIALPASHPIQRPFVVKRQVAVRFSCFIITETVEMLKIYILINELNLNVSDKLFF